MKNKQNITLSDYSFEYPVIKGYNRYNYTPFGKNNLFPNELLEMVQKSPIQSSILSKKETYIYGAGLEKYTQTINNPNLMETWSELIQKVISDFVIFEAFAIQLIMNESGDCYSFYHVPIQQVRLGGYDERNIIQKAYLCADWKYNSKKVEIKMFGTETPQKNTPYLLYFKRYSVGNYYYSIPSYLSASNWIKADCELSKYYLNYIKNNFSCNLAIKYPTEVAEEKKAEIYNSLQECFSGADNAGSVLLLFGENGVSPELQKIESSDADLYENVCETVLKYIVSANGLTSPMLAGLQTKSGFSSKADELLSAYNLYKLTTINKDRGFIMDKINYLLQLNNYDRCFALGDYDISAELNGNTAKNDVKEEESINVDVDSKGEITK